jgi:hypothetical protein
MFLQSLLTNPHSTSHHNINNVTEKKCNRLHNIMMQAASISGTSMPFAFFPGALFNEFALNKLIVF